MLRGTQKKRKTYAVLNARPTLQNQITALKVQVSKQKPETQYYRVSGVHTTTSANLETTHYNITLGLVNSLTFRDNVTGDRWSNLALNMKYFMSPDCDSMRILAYVPKKPGSRFSPASNQMTEHPDPSSFWVIHDSYIVHSNDAQSTPTSRKLSLKSLKTIYDSNAGAIEKGEVIITLISWTPGGAGTAYSYGHELVFNNL